MTGFLGAGKTTLVNYILKEQVNHIHLFGLTWHHSPRKVACWFRFRANFPSGLVGPVHIDSRDLIGWPTWSAPWKTCELSCVGVFLVSGLESS